MVTLDKEKLQMTLSANGGWSREQLAIMGVEWPPQRGWKKKLIGRELTDEQFQKLVRIKDRHLSAETLTRIASEMLGPKRKYKLPRGERP